MDLVQKSIQILINGQTSEGAFIACENFGNYRYAWFRDGTYIALALSTYGRDREVYKFIEWTSMVINRYQEKMESCIREFGQKKEIREEAFFHPRFTHDGYEVPGHWGFNQFDGLGTWLWFVSQFFSQNPQFELSPLIENAMDLAARYLSAVWPLGCSDCWEEHEGGQHTYTLASIVAGLRDYAKLSGLQIYNERADSVWAYLSQNCLDSNGYIKSKGSDAVDANLIGLCEPYGLVPWEDPDFQKTVSRIEKELMTPGLHRFADDSYYGGGEWILLTAWIGWAYAKHNRIQEAIDLRHWVESQADSRGFLAEQVPQHLFKPEAYDQWVKDTGEIATPLLWSHAMYLLMVKEIEKRM